MRGRDYIKAVIRERVEEIKRLVEDNGDVTVDNLPLFRFSIEDFEHRIRLGMLAEDYGVEIEIE